jgi:peptidoglycan/xylan/chitin deacetylase (PgdA/CDA1 family)
MTRIIILIISIFVFIFTQLSKRLKLIAGRELNGRAIVLYYHAVTIEDRKKFAMQMDELIRRATPITAAYLGTLENAVHHVAVTFDDGFVSVINNALPELSQRGVPSTIFVPAGYLGHQATWIIDDKHPLRYETVMSSEQLKNLKSNLVSIGSHCMTHHNLLSISNEEAKEEISQSKLRLESILCKEVTLLSFPHGFHNDTLIKMSRELGYKRVFTILPTFAYSNKNEYVTGRVKADPTDWRLEFRLRLIGAYCWLPWAYALKKKVKMYL